MPNLIECVASRPIALAAVFAVSYLAWCLLVGIYNITSHPLARVPGLKYRGAFYLAESWEIWTGNSAANRKVLHDKYGPVVRIAPKKVSFNTGAAWHDIYGQTAHRKPIPKDKDVYQSGRDGVADILSAGDADHSRIRRLLSHALSEAALREQEPILHPYFDLLIRKLGEQIDGPTNEVVDIVRWFNFTTFDVIGDLAFAEPFHALRDEDYHTWIAQLFQRLKFARLFRLFRLYPIFGVPVLTALSLFPSLSKARFTHDQYTKDKASRRLDMGTDRRDFMSYLLRHNDKKGMTRDEIVKMSGSLIVAGSETSATILSGAMFHLLKNQDKLSKLSQEIRMTFSDAKSMTVLELARLPYLSACLREAFRMYPPVPGMLPRRTQPGGAVIAGHYIPEDISVGLTQWSTYRSAANFTDPDEYVPERWLGEGRYVEDDRSAVQPFSTGPRNCLGQHLAWAEIRGILARVLWNFDVDLRPGSEHWDDQKVFILWQKPALMVRLQQRETWLLQNQLASSELT